MSPHTPVSHGVNGTKLYQGTSWTPDNNLCSRTCSKTGDINLTSLPMLQVSMGHQHRGGTILSRQKLWWCHQGKNPPQEPLPWPPPAHNHSRSCCCSTASVTPCRKTSSWVSKEKQKQNWNQSQGFSTSKSETWAVFILMSLLPSWKNSNNTEKMSRNTESLKLKMYLGEKAGTRFAF